MRRPAFAFVVALASCGPSAQELDACRTAPDCLLDNAVCDRICVEEADCCACLVQLSCLPDGFDADLCRQNLDDGGAISVDRGCDTDEARCGAQCRGVLATVE